MSVNICCYVAVCLTWVESFNVSIHLCVAVCLTCEESFNVSVQLCCSLFDMGGKL